MRDDSMVDPFSDLLHAYQAFHPNAEGAPDIETLAYLPFETPIPLAPHVERFVLVLVEDRLLQPTEELGLSADALLARLQRWKLALEKENCVSRFLRAKLYQGSKHQDGRVLLSLRRFFTDVRDAFPGFTGAVLVGSFPEATLVRRMVWPLRDGGFFGYPGKPAFVCGPGYLADRSDLPLMDLTGTWDQRYTQEPFRIEHLDMAVQDPSPWPPVDDATYTSIGQEFRRHSNFITEDVFFIDDDQYQAKQNADGTLSVQFRFGRRPPEARGASLWLSNRIATPTIHLSRINARHIALKPRRQKFLDEHGRPQKARIGKRDLEPHDPDFWQHSLQLERRLLVEYFDRNHAFRSAPPKESTLRAAIATSDFSAENIQRALAIAAPNAQPGSTIENGSLTQYLAWLRSTAHLRGLMAHSDPFGTAWMQSPREQVEEQIPFPPYWWNREDEYFVPGFFTRDGKHNSRADCWLHRSLWESRILHGCDPSVVVHAGCQLNSPAFGYQHPYNHPRYGFAQGAESILFFLNAVAVVARSKVYNDWPDGLMTHWSDQRTLGDAVHSWLHSHGNEHFSPFATPERTKSYSWSLLGDWTLTPPGA